MRQHTPGLTLAGIAALFLVACGGGGGGSSSSSSGGGTNTAPVANAGANQTVNSGVTVTLNGGASSDADGTIASYAWSQTGGTPNVPLNVTLAQPTFQAPTVTTASVFTFSLIVTDNRGTASAPATVTVTVNPAVAGNSEVTGRVTFARVPFATTAPFGLNYASPVQRPARGVMVEAIQSATSIVLATGFTNDLGDYALSVPNNTDVTMRVTAQMQRTGAPSWDVRVINRLQGNTVPHIYYDDGFFNSSAGTPRNIAIPSGIDATGSAAGARPSGAFAILDTIYQGMQTILAVAPTTTFPALVVDWGSQTNGTFFQGGPDQYIALLADLTEDTDEFDQHVIAHEFGHYIEYNFSRADNIGGSHAVGDKLDPRVAFGEGFGYAFAGMVLNDPNARDSYFDGTTHRSGGFDIEFNPPANPAGASGGNYGCWCSESSVWSILWDLYDNSADANDTLALGFGPIWNVLIGPQATTPAFTTIFSFITAIKAQNAASIAAINTVVAAQNIDAATIDAYGSTETHFPTSVPSVAALPLYATANLGGPGVVLRNVNDAGRHNKLGNRRFIRFNVPTSRSVTITATSSNANTPDIDFRVFRFAGDFSRLGVDPPSENPEVETFTAAAGDYVLDVYDCANGCDAEQGTAGDYDLTVTVN
jgi:hypothetical protein